MKNKIFQIRTKPDQILISNTTGEYFKYVSTNKYRKLKGIEIKGLKH